ncbi:MAG: hypothetical protein F6K08_11825 [Okeania sp. SIO1H6]|nr:hypothetical protein [Okeania sp. SIO1H6]
MDFEKDVDWATIAENLPPMENTRIISGPLSQYDYYFEKAFVNAANRSLAGDAQSLLTAQLRQHFEERCKTIYFLAKQHSLSFEEAFVRLATDKPLSN